MTHDFWIMMLLITLLFYKYSLCVVNQKEIGKGWGVLGGIAFLTNPILGMISIILTFLPYTKTCLKKRLIILSVTLIVCSPWIIRNYIVFNQFILVKSNLYFDMYQGNYLDEDGLLDDNTFINYHPYKNSSVRSIYTVMGEKNFLAEYRKKLIVKLQEEPMTFIKKSINRLVKTFLVCPILSGEVKSAGLIGYLQYMIKASIYCLPFLLSIFYVIKKDFRINKTIQIAIIIFFLYLSPYIFVGFYTRYRIPLSPIFSILYFYFFSMYALDYFCWFKRITVLPKDSK